MNTLLTRLRDDKLLLGATVLAVLSLVVAFIRQYYFRTFSSDDVTIQLLLRNTRLFDGLDAWTGPDNFFVKAPFYWIANLFPSSPLNLLLLALVMMLVGTILYLIAARSILPKQPLAVVALGLAWLYATGPNLVQFLVNPNGRNLEVGIMIAALAGLGAYFVGDWTPRHRLAWGIAGTAFLGFFFYSDPFFVYVLAIPVLLMIATSLLADTHNRWLMRGIQVAGIIVGAVVLHAVFELVAEALGYRIAGQISASFITLEMLPVHLGLTAVAATYLFSADFWGRQFAHPETLRTLLNAFFMVITLLAPLLLGFKNVRQSPVKAILVIYPAIVVGIYAINSNIVNIMSSRYLVVLPFLTPLIIGLLYGLLPKRFGRALVGLLAVSLVLNTGSTLAKIDTGNNPNRDDQAMVLALTQRDLTKGYAQYWRAGIASYLSNDAIGVGPVECLDGRLSLRKWLVDETVFERPAKRSFYIDDAAEPAMAKCRGEGLIRQLGAPNETVKVTETLNLLVYDRDLYDRLK